MRHVSTRTARRRTRIRPACMIHLKRLTTKKSNDLSPIPRCARDDSNRVLSGMRRPLAPANSLFPREPSNQQLKKSARVHIHAHLGIRRPSSRTTDEVFNDASVGATRELTSAATLLFPFQVCASDRPTRDCTRASHPPLVRPWFPHQHKTPATSGSSDQERLLLPANRACSDRREIRARDCD